MNKILLCSSNISKTNQNIVCFSIKFKNKRKQFQFLSQSNFKTNQDNSSLFLNTMSKQTGRIILCFSNIFKTKPNQILACFSNMFKTNTHRDLVCTLKTFSKQKKKPSLYRKTSAIKILMWDTELTLHFLWTMDTTDCRHTQALLQRLAPVALYFQTRNQLHVSFHFDTISRPDLFLYIYPLKNHLPNNDSSIPQCSIN